MLHFAAIFGIGCMSNTTVQSAKSVLKNRGDDNNCRAAPVPHFPKPFGWCRSTYLRRDMIDWEQVKKLRDEYAQLCTEFQEASDVYTKANIVRQDKHRKMNEALAALNAAMLPEFNKADDEAT